VLAVGGLQIRLEVVPPEAEFLCRSHAGLKQGTEVGGAAVSEIRARLDPNQRNSAF
jgi:hypothetical protein